MIRNLFSVAKAACLGLGVAVAVGCAPQNSAPPTAEAPATPTPVESAAPTPAPATPATGDGTQAQLVEEPGPAGGTISKLYLLGPETAVIASCAQLGFEPFLFRDMGENWVGCQLTPSASAGAEVDQPISLGEAPSPVGGTVQKISIPGPQLAAVVACRATGFVPFLYRDAGENWVGCKAE